MGATEIYVIGLLEKLLGPCERGKRFPWALGDVSSTTGRAVRLPFDAVWEERKLIVEVDEEQHREATSFFDKPQRMTVSGVDRGEQRRLYDIRKREAARRAGYKVLVIEWSRRQERRKEKDIGDLRRQLEQEELLQNATLGGDSPRFLPPSGPL